MFKIVTKQNNVKGSILLNSFNENQYTLLKTIAKK